MARKTIEIEKIKGRINDHLLHTKDECSRERQALMLFLENILHDTGNYRGFGYLNWKDMERSASGSTVGVNYDKNGDLLPYDEENQRFKGTDKTRVFYY